MDYQELYAKYQAAIKFRELSQDKNFELLKDVFIKKILSNISFSSPNEIIPYLAGMKEVFDFVDDEISRIDGYRDELDRLFTEGK